MYIEVGIFAKKNNPRGKMTDITHAWNTPEDDERGGRLFLLADGSGRGNFAQIASEAAIHQARQNFYHVAEENPDAYIEDILREVLISTNQQLYKQARKANAQGNMGASIIAAVLREDQLTIAWVGNCRAYVLYADTDAAQQATFDTHNDETGALMIMGNASDTRIGVYSMELDDGDVVMLCSDGLYEALPQDEFARTIRQHTSVHMAAAQMVNQAIQTNGRDNASVLVLQVHRQEPHMQTATLKPGTGSFGTPEPDPLASTELPAVTTPTVSQTQVNELVTDLELDLFSEDTETQEVVVSNIFDDVHPDQQMTEDGAVLPFPIEDVSDFEFEDDNPFEFEPDANVANDSVSFEDDQDEFFAFDDEDDKDVRLPDFSFNSEPPIRPDDTMHGDSVSSEEDAAMFGEEEESFDAFFDSIMQATPTALEPAEPDKQLVAEDEILALVDEDTHTDDNTFFDGDFDDLMKLEKVEPSPQETETQKRFQIRQMNTVVVLFSGILILAAVLLLGSSYLLRQINANPTEQLPTIAVIARGDSTSTGPQRLIVTGQADNPKSPTEEQRSPSPTAAQRTAEVPNGWVSGTVLYITEKTGYRRDVFSPPLDATQFIPGDEVVISLARQTVGYREWYEYDGERWWFVDNIGWLAEAELSEDPPR